MSQSSSTADSLAHAKLEAKREWFVRVIDVARSDLDKPQPDAQHLRQCLRQAAQDLLRELECDAREERYLSQDFPKQVTAHFHEAKRRSLECEPTDETPSADGA